MTSDALVTLDRSGEIWVGTFPTLGVVRIHPDGAVEVEAQPVEASEPDAEPESLEWRVAALRHGWAEPLSLVRRGFHLIVGTAVTPPDTDTADPGCLVLRGPVHDIAMVMTELFAHGWRMLANRVVPVRWTDGVLIAHPRDTPTVIAKGRARKLEIEGTRLRADSDARSIEVARHTVPTPVRATVSISMRRPDESVLRVAEGHERFQAATSLIARGVLWPAGEDLTPPQVMQRHLELTSLPTADLTVSDESLADDAAELWRWWSATVGEGAS